VDRGRGSINFGGEWPYGLRLSYRDVAMIDVGEISWKCDNENAYVAEKGRGVDTRVSSGVRTTCAQ
jgi:hypothetical protein